MKGADFIQSVIDKFNNGDCKVLSWNSEKWAYEVITDIRTASKEDVLLCAESGFDDTKEGDYVVEIEEEDLIVKPIGAIIAECDTIVVKEIL